MFIITSFPSLSQANFRLSRSGHLRNVVSQLVNPDGTEDEQINIVGLLNYREPLRTSPGTSASTCIVGTAPAEHSDESNLESVLSGISLSEEEDIDTIGTQYSH